jgi:uncharacterized protein YPO0396
MPDIKTVTLDEAFARITNELSGRTFEACWYDGLDLVIRTECGHEVHLAATTEHVIMHKKTDVCLTLDGVSMFCEAGKL